MAKLLILSQEWSRNYDKIVWIDTDIIINNDIAIDVITNVPENKIGAVEAYSIPTREIHEISLKRMYCSWEKQGVKYIDNITPGLYYENRGIHGGKEFDSVVQTGVFVCSPVYHKEIFEHIYNNYEDKNGAEWNYEMPAMSYELVKNDMHFWISPLFNFCVLINLMAFYPFIE